MRRVEQGACSQLCVECRTLFHAVVMYFKVPESPSQPLAVVGFVGSQLHLAAGSSERMHECFAPAASTRLLHSTHRRQAVLQPGRRRRPRRLPLFRQHRCGVLLEVQPVFTSGQEVCCVQWAFQGHLVRFSCTTANVYHFFDSTGAGCCMQLAFQRHMMRFSCTANVYLFFESTGVCCCSGESSLCAFTSAACSGHVRPHSSGHSL